MLVERLEYYDRARPWSTLWGDAIKLTVCGVYQQGSGEPHRLLPYPTVGALRRSISHSADRVLRTTGSLANF